MNGTIPSLGVQINVPHAELKTNIMGKFGFSFSWKRALGISSEKQRFARQTGIPTTTQGLERKIGSSIMGFIFKLLFGKK